MIFSNINSILHNSITKTIAAIWAVVFMPIQTELGLLGLLFFIDTFTGVLQAIRNGYFNANRIPKAAYKAFLYMLLIFASGVFEKIISNYYNTNMITIFIVGILAMTEFISILENLSAMGVPIPDMFDTIFKDLRNKNINQLLVKQEAKRKLTKNFEILMNKYLMLIESKEARYLLGIKFKIWNKYIIENILNNKITNKVSFINKYNLVVEEAKYQVQLIVKHHKNLEDEYMRFGKYSEEQINILKHNVNNILDNEAIKMPNKNIAIAELHMDLLYKTFNEVLILENHKTSTKEYFQLK